LQRDSLFNTLESNDIKDSKQLVNNTAIKKDRNFLAYRCKLLIDALTELVQLCDLVRIIWFDLFLPRIFMIQKFIL